MQTSLAAPDMFDRIVTVPGILGGKPIVRGTRMSVEVILEFIASGATREQIAAQYPPLTVEDVEQAIQYAAASMRNDVFLTVASGV